MFVTRCTKHVQEQNRQRDGDIRSNHSLLYHHMPSEQSTWLLAVPQNGDSEGIEQELTTKLSQQSRSFTPNNIAYLGIPSFKVTSPSLFRLTRSSRIDGYSRLSNFTIRRTSQARFVLCRNHRQGRRNSSQSAQQRCEQTLAASSRQ